MDKHERDVILRIARALRFDASELFRLAYGQRRLPGKKDGRHSGHNETGEPESSVDKAD